MVAGFQLLLLPGQTFDLIGQVIHQAAPLGKPGFRPGFLAVQLTNPQLVVGLLPGHLQIFFLFGLVLPLLLASLLNQHQKIGFLEGEV